MWLLEQGAWYEFYDRVERIPKFLQYLDVTDFRKAMNDLFKDENVGYCFEEDKIVKVGTQEFDDAVEGARTALQDEKYAEALRQFERGLDFRNGLPPDWSNAIKEAVNSVEAVLQIIYSRKGETLTKLVSEELPRDTPSNVKSLFKSLYGLGSGTVGARHASVGGNELRTARAQSLCFTLRLHCMRLQSRNWKSDSGSLIKGQQW